MNEIIYYIKIKDLDKNNEIKFEFENKKIRDDVYKVLLTRTINARNMRMWKEEKNESR